MKKEYRNNKNQVIGVLNEDNIYRSVRQGHKHILRLMDAWGVDADVVNDLRKEDVKEIRILDDESAVVYTTSLQNFNDKSVLRHFDTPQLFMSRKYWNTYEKK